MGLHANVGERHVPSGSVAITDRFSSDATHNLSVLGSVVAAVGGSAYVVVVSDGSHVLGDTYGENLGSGYSQKLVEYAIFDLHLLKQCLRKVSSSVFGALDCISKTDFILKWLERCDWIMSRSGHRRAIITGELSMPSLLEVVSNIVRVWPLIVVYLEETRRKIGGVILSGIIHSLLFLELQILSYFPTAV